MASLKEAGQKAQEIDKILRCTYPGFRGSAQIIHEDGTSLLFRNAFVVEYKGFALVFSEHNGIYVNSLDDLSFCDNIPQGIKELNEEEITLWNERDKAYDDILAKKKDLFPPRSCSVGQGSEGNVWSTIVLNEHEFNYPSNSKGENIKQKWKFSVEFVEESVVVKKETYEEIY